MEVILTVHEAKSNFSDMLNRVARREEIVITKDGVPAARIIPEGKPTNKEMASWIEGLISRRISYRINRPGDEKISMRELIEDGRR